MSDIKDYIHDNSESVIKEVDSFICNNDQTMKWFNCLKLPVCIAEELVSKVIDSNTNRGSMNISDFIVASLTTRYLYELTANLCVMLNTEPEELRNERQEQWLRLRDLDIIGSSYAMPLNNAPKQTRNRLVKKEDDITKIKGSTQNRQEYSIPSEYSVPIKDNRFLFEDPWGLNISQKVKLMPLGDPNRFLEQWKLYSHIAHASAFSLTPTWIEPVPINDAIQVYSLLLKVISDFLGFEFNERKFLENSFSLIYSHS